jgi:hypothetical protein
MPDERCHETELNHFWNALNRDIAAPAAVTLDPGQTETLRRLRDMTAATPPAAVRARLDREVRSLLDRPANGSEPVDPRQIQLFIQGPALWQDDRPSPGAAQRPLPRPAAGRIGWAAAQLATVSLVLLALGLGMFTVGSGTAVLDRWRGMLSSFGPGSTGDLASETVFAANLPAEMIPAAGNLDFVLWNVALDPGVEGPASSQSWTQTRICCPGPMIVHVLEGVLSMRVEGPLRVFRASNGALGAGAVPPGTEVTLSPGDTAVFSYDLPAARRQAQRISITTKSIPCLGCPPGRWMPRWSAPRCLPTQKSPRRRLARWFSKSAPWEMPTSLRTPTAGCATSVPRRRRSTSSP